MSRKGKDNPNYGNGRIIQRYNKFLEFIDEGEINYFISLGFNKFSVYGCCSGTKPPRTTQGFVFKYKGNDFKNMERKVQSEETKKRRSLSKSGINHPLYGKTHSEESKAKMRGSQRLKCYLGGKRKRTGMGKTIIQMKDDIIIKEGKIYEFVNDGFTSTCIYSCINNKQKIHKNFTFKLK